jgi:hypothetical protein
MTCTWVHDTKTDWPIDRRPQFNFNFNFNFNAREYNWATLSLLREINTGTWPSMLGEFQK